MAAHRRRPQAHNAFLRDTVRFSDSPEELEALVAKELAAARRRIKPDDTLDKDTLDKALVYWEWIKAYRDGRPSLQRNRKIAKAKIVKPLGSGALPVVKAFCSKGTHEAAMGCVDDLREEESQALADGEKLHAWVIGMRCRLLLAKLTLGSAFGAVVRYVFRTFIGFIAK